MNRIKDLLKEKGVTINELADKMGISSSNVIHSN